MNSIIPEFTKELEKLINKYSMENGSDTPDFLLAEYLTGCLVTFDKVVLRRSVWYGKEKADRIATNILYGAKPTEPELGT